MARSSPWSVKGVDQDARQIAREAAKRHGLTIGAWVDRAIKMRAESSNAAKSIAPPVEIGSAETSGTAPSTSKIDAPLTGKESQTERTPVEPAGIQFDVEKALRMAREKNRTPEKEDVAAKSDLDVKRSQADSKTIIAASATSKFSRHSRIGLLGSAVIAALVSGVWFYENNLRSTSPGQEQQAVVKPEPSAPSKKPIVQTATSKAPPVTTETATADTDKPSPPQATSVAAVTQPPVAGSTKGGDLEALKQQATDGNHQAQFDLANRYLSGNGVTKSQKQAIPWLKKAANGGIAPAQYNLGLLYEVGSGVKKSPATALSWYRKAADKGHARAQHNLGTLYAQGKGTAKSYKDAAYWFKKGSENGLADSLYSLGLMHEHGLGLPKNAKIATAYYNKALAAGSAEAAQKLKQTNFAANTSPTQTEIAKAVKTQPAAGNPKATDLNKAEIADIQKLLARLDLTPGSSDGVIGKKTVEAIKMYQRFAGLKVNGQATRELLSDLRQVVGAMAPVKASAPAPADR